jgi:hypothetical protein
MKKLKNLKSFDEIQENLNSNSFINHIKQISNDFTKVAHKYDLMKVNDTLDYEGEFAEDLENNIYSVNIWIKDENLSPNMRNIENQRIVIGIMFLNPINEEEFKKDCQKTLPSYNIESMKFTHPEERTQRKTFEICIKI